MPNQPLVSIDTVPFIVHDDVLHVVLGIRGWDPCAGQAALPGVLLNANERIDEAVDRALQSKIGATRGHPTLDAGVFDDFERDERGPTLSIARAVILDLLPVDERVRIAEVTDLPELPFDHNAIITHTAGVVLDALWVNASITRALLGEEFSTADVIARTKELAATAGREPDVANIGRKLAGDKRLAKKESAPVGRGRPPARWVWAF
ncbi:hypothetical protein [Glutamicibacter sp. NPDC087344]|uniref:hypothetical protein n=1 Tax=Glutamicibacter sp. NPDC087344 TaxID=3363994 RepID=UPI003829CEA7